jgi:hypothetical protein
MSVSALAAVAGVGRTRASAVLSVLAELGVVSRREVGPTVLVRLERRNAGGKLLAELADLRNSVISRLRQLALSLDPPPLSMALFGSFARGDSDSASDIDILAVRPAGGGGDRWAESLTEFSAQARILTGNSIQILDYDLSDLTRRAGARDDDAGASFWRAVTEDALLLAGADLSEALGIAALETDPRSQRRTRSPAEPAS